MRRSPVPPEILARTGARTTRAVPSEVRALLDAGEIETVNLCEWLVVDQAALAGRVLADLGRGADHAGLVRLLSEAPATAPRRQAVIAGFFDRIFPGATLHRTVVAHLMSHRSDVVRAWSAGMIGCRPGWTVARRLKAVRPLAADGNMSVREMAWMAVREPIASDLDAAIGELAGWAADPDPNLRRFASEATRPRGVWCRHIPELKADPGRGMPILEPLRADPSRYVQDSVGNWLNDASKTRPEWVRGVTARWTRESADPATRRIVRRALRTLARS